MNSPREDTDVELNFRLLLAKFNAYKPEEHGKFIDFICEKEDEFEDAEEDLVRMYNILTVAISDKSLRDKHAWERIDTTKLEETYEAIKPILKLMYAFKTYQDEKKELDLPITIEDFQRYLRGVPGTIASAALLDGIDPDRFNRFTTKDFEHLCAMHLSTQKQAAARSVFFPPKVDMGEYDLNKTEAAKLIYEELSENLKRACRSPMHDLTMMAQNRVELMRDLFILEHISKKLSEKSDEELPPISNMSFYFDTLSLEDAKAAYKLFQEYPRRILPEITKAYNLAQNLLRDAGIKGAHARPASKSSRFFSPPDEDKTPLTAKPSQRPRKN